MRKKPELLIPASSLEVLKIAVVFGADAVYIGGEAFGLRAKARNFSMEDMREGIAFAHEYGVKVYVTANILAHNKDLPGVREYFQELKEIKPDALIISDPGIYMIAKEVCPEIERHISTQANNTNYGTYLFWWNLGAKRVVSARELSLEEIREIRSHIPEEMEIETFIHGAMCISYSGRCLLSSFMTGRSANQGNCSHPCRYHYALMEEKRPGEFFPIEEDDRGSYIMNSRDLCLIDYIPQLCSGQFASLKIEGRNKSAYYVANAVRIYRAAIDAYAADPNHYSCDPQWHQELAKISHREYTAAFAEGQAASSSMRYDDGGYIREYDFTAIIKEISDSMLLLEQRNHIAVGDQLEIICPDGKNIPLTAVKIFDEDGVPLSAARHPRQLIQIPNPGLPGLKPPLIVRRPVK